MIIPNFLIARNQREEMKNTWVGLLLWHSHASAWRKNKGIFFNNFERRPTLLRSKARLKSADRWKTLVGQKGKLTNHQNTATNFPRNPIGPGQLIYILSYHARCRRCGVRSRWRDGQAWPTVRNSWSGDHSGQADREAHTLQRSKYINNSYLKYIYQPHKIHTEIYTLTSI